MNHKIKKVKNKKDIFKNRLQIIQQYIVIQV